MMLKRVMFRKTNIIVVFIFLIVLSNGTGNNSIKPIIKQGSMDSTVKTRKKTEPMKKNLINFVILDLDTNCIVLEKLGDEYVIPVAKIEVNEGKFANEGKYLKLEFIPLPEKQHKFHNDPRMLKAYLNIQGFEQQTLEYIVEIVRANIQKMKLTNQDTKLQKILSIFKFLTERYNNILRPVHVTSTYSETYQISNETFLNVKLMISKFIDEEGIYKNYKVTNFLNSSNKKVKRIEFCWEEFGKITNSKIQHGFAKITMNDDSIIYIEFAGEPSTLIITIAPDTPEIRKGTAEKEKYNYSTYNTYDMKNSPLYFSGVLNLILKWDIEYSFVGTNCMDFIKFFERILAQNKYINVKESKIPTYPLYEQFTNFGKTLVSKVVSGVSIYGKQKSENLIQNFFSYFYPSKTLTGKNENNNDGDQGTGEANKEEGNNEIN
jgi:hypothetical protein